MTEMWSYTELWSHLGQVDAARMLQDGTVHTLTGDVEHVTRILPAQVDTLSSAFVKRGVDFSVMGPSTATTVAAGLLNLLPLLFFSYIALSLLRGGRMMGGGGGLQGVQNFAAEAVSDARFDDVAGLAGPKEELQEIVSFLKDPTAFHEVGAKVPKGVLLEGPPGTGKTLLARAVAGEADCNFLSASASSFVEMYVGLGAARVRSLFQAAREASPCIVWIDEIDALARKRGQGRAGGNEERETTLNELLTAMDGFDVSDSVVVLAATNRADLLDDAVLRPGRFDRRVSVSLPSVHERREILGVHAKNKPIGEDVSLDQLARDTPGFSGAQLANLLNEAAIRAIRRGGRLLNRDDVVDALERVVVGLKGSTEGQSDRTKRRVAVHEAGHALVSTALGDDEVARVTIVPRSNGAGGFTSFRGDEDKLVGNLLTKKDLTSKICVLLAGRAAEEVVLGEDTISTGASNDLMRVQSIARDMINKLGMGRSLSTSDDETSEGARFGNDSAVRNLIDDCYDSTVKLLQDHVGALNQITDLLVEQETIEGSVIRDILAK